GRTLAAVGDASKVPLRLWDLETKAERALTGHTGHILGLSFHPGGKLVATAAWDGTVRLWGVTPESHAMRIFDFHSAEKAWSAAPAREGLYLIAGLENGAIPTLRAPAVPPEYVPPPTPKPPVPAELAKRVVAADGLKRADIPEELLKMAGGGDKDK